MRGELGKREVGMMGGEGKRRLGREGKNQLGVK